jgi:hypothetical protein
MSYRDLYSELKPYLRESAKEAARDFMFCGKLMLGLSILVQTASVSDKAIAKYMTAHPVKPSGLICGHGLCTQVKSVQ